MKKLIPLHVENSVNDMGFRGWAAISILGLLVCGCGQDRDLVPDQQSYFENYLSSNNITDYIIQDGVYRFVPNSNRASYATDIQVASGDSVSFMFEAYPFTSGPQVMYYTNKAEKISGDTIINTRYWSFDPVKACVGKTDLIEGVTRGLPGCREGDSVVMLITTDLAYGKVAVGVVPANSAIMMILNIKEVKK